MYYFDQEDLIGLDVSEVTRLIEEQEKEEEDD